MTNQRQIRRNFLYGEIETLKATKLKVWASMAKYGNSGYKSFLQRLHDSIAQQIIKLEIEFEPLETERLAQPEIMETRNFLNTAHRSRTHLLKSA